MFRLKKNPLPWLATPLFGLALFLGVALPTTAQEQRLPHPGRLNGKPKAAEPKPVFTPRVTPPAPVAPAIGSLKRAYGWERGAARLEALAQQDKDAFMGVFNQARSSEEKNHL